MSGGKGTMKTAEVTKRETDLISMYNEAKEASRQFSEACAVAALHAETTPAVVRRYIVAIAGEKANQVVNETEQLSMLFLALPTVQGAEL